MADNIKNSSESNAWGSRDSKTRKADSNKRCSKSEYSHKRKLSLGKGAGVEKQFHKRRLKYREGTENRWDYFFPSMSVTLPWESKATGEPDLAELRVSASPLHQDMALIYNTTVVRITVDRPPRSVWNQWMCYWDGNTLAEHRSPLLKTHRLIKTTHY